MSKKRFFLSTVILSLTLLAFVSCEGIFPALNKLGIALDKSKVNVLGYNGSAKKQAEEVTKSLFDGEDSIFNRKDEAGKTQIDKITDEVNSLLKSKYNKDELTKGDDGTGGISLDKIYDQILSKFAFESEKGYQDFLASLGDMKSKEAKDEFAKDMREPAGLELDGEFSSENIKNKVDEVKKSIDEDTGMDSTTKEIINAVMDCLVTEDGEITKGSLLLASSVATTFKNIKKSVGEDGELGSLDETKNDELLKQNSGEFINLATVATAIVGEDTKEGQAIFSAINKLISGGK